MFEILQTTEFETWMTNLRDMRARSRVALRIRRASLGNLGDVRSVGDGVSEMRIDTGPGYRLYFTYVGTRIVFLLCGGDKSSQWRDITLAKTLAREVR